MSQSLGSSLFVTIQLAITAYKSKSGLGRSQRFFFKSRGVETVDGWRLKEDATVEDKVFPIRGNSTCLDKGRLRTKQNSAGKLPGKEILSDKSLNPQALATVRKILRDFFLQNVSNSFSYLLHDDFAPLLSRLEWWLLNRIKVQHPTLLTKWSQLSQIARWNTVRQTGQRNFAKVQWNLVLNTLLSFYRRKVCETC